MKVAPLKCRSVVGRQRGDVLRIIGSVHFQRDANGVVQALRIAVANAETANAVPQTIEELVAAEQIALRDIHCGESLRGETPNRVSKSQNTFVAALRAEPKRRALNLVMIGRQETIAKSGEKRG